MLMDSCLQVTFLPQSVVVKPCKTALGIISLLGMVLNMLARCTGALQILAAFGTCCKKEVSKPISNACLRHSILFPRTDLDQNQQQPKQQREHDAIHSSHLSESAWHVSAL